MRPSAAAIGPRFAALCIDPERDDEAHERRIVQLRLNRNRIRLMP